MTTATPNPSLPQNDSAALQEKRRESLDEARKAYVYNHDSIVRPLGVAASVPKGERFAPILAGGVVLVALDLLGNVLATASKLDGAKLEAALDAGERAAVATLLAHLRDKHRQLTGILTTLHVDTPRAAPRFSVAGVLAFVEKVEEEAKTVVEDLVGGRGLATTTDPIERFAELIKDLLEAFLSAAGTSLLKAMGLSGQATNLYQFAEQFQTLRLQEVASNFQEDLTFARMRLAGPNPLVITRMTAPDPRFPVTDAQLQAVLGATDSLGRAMAEGRLYLADYQALTAIVPGTFPSQQKYLEAPLALFAVPAADQRDRRLRAIAIQLSQVPGHQSPIFTPSGGVGWEIAKLHVQVADGNHHELISHLGQTHLVIEAFAMATPRQLAPEHPLNVLLMPHLEGTLAINDAAVASLISAKGPVDRLLSGTIDSSVQLSVQSVLAFHFNAQMLPQVLADRGVADAVALPDYPYRDDARLVWDSIHGWVSAYLAVYYNTDADVQGDTELQGWLADLASTAGGGLADIGQSGAIRTFGYLVDMVTMVIFTASAQHAAVNFQQNFIMSFTPAMPLAAYAPAPTVSGGDLPPEEIYNHLPPLQEAMLQLMVGHALGGVYFTRLGDYDRNIPGHHFTDPRVQEALTAFQVRLFEVERIIGKRNLERTPYVLLLPSSIPQSINI